MVILHLGVIALALALATLPVPAGVVERLYSGSAYRAWQPLATSLSNRVPIALFDVLAVLVCGRLMVLLVRLVAPGRHGRLATLLRVASLGALLYVAFMAGWGLNYRRAPLSSRLDHGRDRVTPAAAQALAERIVAGLNKLERDGVRAADPTWEQAASALVQPFELVLAQLGEGRRFTGGNPKWSALTYYFERAGVDAMTDPFFLEVLVNQQLLAFERPAVLAHEWAHLAGYADEADANFVGWIACLQGPGATSYSAHLAILWQLAPALEADARNAVMKRLSPGPRADMKAIAERLSGANPTVRRVGWRVYDRYLKANRVEEGVASYEAAIRLLLGTRFTREWVPARRK